MIFIEPKVVVYAFTPEVLTSARELARKLSLPFISEVQGEGFFTLEVTADAISLRLVKKGAPGALTVDFTSGAIDFRRRYGGLGGQMVLNAVGGVGKSVLDATAGLCRDAFILASGECQVHALEKSPIIFTLVSDALRRGLAYSKTAGVCGRIRLENQDATAYLAKTDASYDAIYLDPMFPEKTKSALPKKELRLLQLLLGEGDDSAVELFRLAKSHTQRIVVKRPLRAPPLVDKPSITFKGTSTRFDVYIF